MNLSDYMRSFADKCRLNSLEALKINDNNA